MLLLLFKTGDRQFAMVTSKIREIVPLVKLTALPCAPDFTAGLMNYRGNSIPVIDLCLLTAGKSSTPKLSTRIIIVDYDLGEGRSGMLGLIAEHVVETIKSKLSTVPISPTNLEDLLDRPVTRVTTETKIEWFDPEQMLPTREINELFTLHAGVPVAGKPQLVCE